MPMTITEEIQTTAELASRKVESPVRARLLPWAILDCCVSGGVSSVE